MKILAALLALSIMLCKPVAADKLQDAKSLYYGKSYAEAYDLLLPLAEQDVAEAQYLVGRIYQLGQGRAIDYSRSAAWMEKAAKQGHPEANLELGFYYLRGIGVAKDRAKAEPLLRFAATNCVPDGATFLGALYQVADPPLRDPALGVGWLFVAESLASRRAAEFLVTAALLLDKDVFARGKALYPSLKATVDCGGPS